MERTLKAMKRDSTGKESAHKVRASGRVPAVVYGHGAHPIHVTVDSRELFHLLHTDAGANVLVDLKVDSEDILTMPREIQRDHIRGRLLHVDFLRIDRHEKIAVQVPIHLVGDSRGVREGGVVEHHLWELHLECLPQEVPTHIEANIADLGIGDSLRVESLPVPSGATVLTSPEETVVSIVTPQVLRVAEEAPEVAEGEEEGAPAAEGEEAEAEGSAETSES
jgi:large subunit ribosomal protein L25